MHGEAKTCHGLRRAARRGLANVAIQAYLTAAVMNLKRLAASCRARWATGWYEVGGVLRGAPGHGGFILRAPSRACWPIAA